MTSPPHSDALAPAPASPVAGGPEPPEAAPRRPDGLAAVPAWAAMLATFLAIFIVPSLALLPVFLIGLGGIEVDLADPPPGFIIPGTLLLHVGLVGAAYGTTRAFGIRVRPSTLGLRGTPAGRALLWTGVVYAGFWVGAIAYSAVLGEPAQQDIVDDLKAQDSLLVLAGFALMVGVAAPLAEEIFFRGFLFGVLREKIGILAAALVAGTIFGLIHAAGTPVRTLGILVILGIGLCFLYAKTGSLLPCMGLHALNNSISFVFTTEATAAVGVLVVAGCVGATLAVGWLLVRSEAPASG